MRQRCYRFSATVHFRRYSRSKSTPQCLDFGAKLLWIYCCGFGTDYVNVKKSMYFKSAGMDSTANQQCFCSKIRNFCEPVGGQIRHVKLLHGFKKNAWIREKCLLCSSSLTSPHQAKLDWQDSSYLHIGKDPSFKLNWTAWTCWHVPFNIRLDPNPLQLPVFVGTFQTHFRLIIKAGTPSDYTGLNLDHYKTKWWPKFGTEELSRVLLL